MKATGFLPFSGILFLRHMRGGRGTGNEFDTRRTMKRTSRYLRDKKTRGRHITMLTCHDYPTALWEDWTGVDVILVGGSVGTNVLRYESEKDVTLDDILHHLKAVKRGVRTVNKIVRELTCRVLL
jgi:hypothetical protein